MAPPWGHTKLINATKKLGIKVERIALPAAWDDILNETNRIGKFFGTEEKAQEIIQKANATIKKIQLTFASQDVLYILPGRYTAGENTHINTAINMAGHNNWLSSQGKTGWGYFYLEQIIMNPPDAMIFSFFPKNFFSLAINIKHHPIIEGFKKKIDLPEKLWMCANWILPQAASRIASELK